MKNTLKFILTVAFWHGCLLTLEVNSQIILPSTSITSNEVCKKLKVRLAKSKGGECCYTVLLTNELPKNVDINSIPMQFEISTSAGLLISSSSPNAGFNQSPTSLGSGVTTLKWETKPKTTPRGPISQPIPSNQSTVSNICLNDYDGWIYFNWLNRKGQSICKDSVFIDCPIQSASLCCPYAIHFAYDRKSPHQYSKIRVSALGSTQIINSISDDWQQTFTTNFVEYHLGGAPLPYGSVIDNDFMIYLDKTTVNHQLKVDWYDISNIIRSTFFINISCNQTYSEDEDWTLYVKEGTPYDPSTYSFVVKEDEEEDCGYEDKYFKTLECGFNIEINCGSSNNYQLQLTGPDGYDQYIWKIEKGGSIYSQTQGKSPTPPALSPGKYEIELNAVIQASSGSDTCTSIQSVEIPTINPAFTYRKIDDCKLLYKFSVDKSSVNSSDIKSVSWSCSSLPSFPSSGDPVQFEFANEGNYEITLIIEDIYGCTHPIKKTISIQSKCQPKFEESFELCGCDDSNRGYKPVEVTFTNESEGGFCPIKYTWKFGDGQTEIHFDKTSVKHTYNLPLRDCLSGQGKKFDVVLTMEDSKGCKVDYPKTIIIKPCKYSFNVEKCPDGKIKMTAKDENGNDLKGLWSLPGGFSLNNFLSSVGVKKSCVVFGVESSGAYNISFEGYCSTNGTCKRDTSINVVVECCSKNQVTKGFLDFLIGSDEYRIKGKFSQRQYPLYHRVNTMTIFQKRKTNKKGHVFYKRHKANEIEASYKGLLYFRDGSNITCLPINLDGGCNCSVEKNKSCSRERFDRKKAFMTHKVGTADNCSDNPFIFFSKRFRSKEGSIMSTHRVKIGPHERKMNLNLGRPNDCDPYNKWWDWY